MAGVGITPPKVLGAPETLVVRHNEQNVGRAFGRHHARGPPRLRLRSFLVDYAAEFRIRWRKLFETQPRARRLAPANMLRLIFMADSWQKRVAHYVEVGPFEWTSLRHRSNCGLDKEDCLAIAEVRLHHCSSLTSRSPRRTAPTLPLSSRQ
jgi:hypothetical protein